MKTTIQTKQLATAIQLAEKMTGKQLSLPSLQGILLIATGKSIKVRATNLNVGCEIEIPAKIESEGTLLLRGEVLSTILVNSTAETVEFETENENLRVTTASSKTLIKTIPPEDFPTLPIVEGQEFIVDAKVLQEGIRTVFFAAAVTDIKPEIASVFIYSDGTSLVFVATDSFRLAEKKIKVKQIPEIPKILIPFKNIPDVLKVLEMTTGDVVCVYNKNQFSITHKTLYFTTRLIDGAFPDYRMIIPKEMKTKVVLLKQELLNTLKLSTLFVDKFSQILFTVMPDERKVVVSSKNSDVGASETTLSAAIEGNAIEVSFNLKYFLDVFQSAIGDSVSLEFTDANRAIVVKSVHDTSFLYLLMPTNR